jgi:hypothetical protein
MDYRPTRYVAQIIGFHASHADGGSVQAQKLDFIGRAASVVVYHDSNITRLQAEA